MILVTGSTGFIGSRLVRRLAGENKLRVRVLLRPGAETKLLPRGIPVYVTTADLNSVEGLTEALDGVHTVYHLVGTGMRGRHSQLENVDIESTRNITEAARLARVGRIIYVSTLGADRASAYPLQKAKGEIEAIIRKSGLAYTIFRTASVFGEGDHFSENLAMLVQNFPLFFVPGEGEAVLQPLWVEDLVSCLAIALENIDMIDETISMGGPELLPYRRIVLRVMYTINASRPIVGLPLLVHKASAWFLDGLFARWPYNERWVELLSANQTTDLGTVERRFGFRPATFDVPVLQTYMQTRSYRKMLLRYATRNDWTT